MNYKVNVEVEGIYAPNGEMVAKYQRLLLEGENNLMDPYLLHTEGY